MLGEAELRCEFVDGELVAQFAGAVLVGEHAWFPDGPIQGYGFDPLDRDDVLGGVGAFVRPRMQVGAFQSQCPEWAAFSVNDEVGFVGGDSGTLDDADPDVAMLRNVHEYPGPYGEGLQGPGVPVAAAGGDEPVGSSIVPGACSPVAAEGCVPVPSVPGGLGWLRAGRAS